MSSRHPWLCALVVSACVTSTAATVAPAAPESPAPAPAPVAGPAPAAPSVDELAFCVEETNRYRKRAGLPPLTRSANLEAFAADGARDDARAKQPHHHFSHVHYPHPFREMGENEIPWWPEKQYGSVHEIIRVGLIGMWDEGPGGGHYENLIGAFTHVGCGIQVEDGTVTVVQDFLRPPS